ncbi:MAG: hypothetical protein JW936_05305 [Sedimentisphaerales bacterium]|nr:hypothetical protein [Sedimentisphaerales bacterium]
MEFLRRITAQVKGQLAGLTTSQRLVIGLLIVIMVGAVWWMVSYSATREMVPLLNQSFNEDEMARIVNKLDGWMVDYEIRGDMLFVPKSESRALLYRLTAEQVMPEDTSIGWSYLVENTDLLVSSAVHQDRRLVVLQSELARMISNGPGVRSAQVIINPGSDRRVGNIAPPASASVTIEMASRGSGNRRTALTAAAIVAGAVNRVRRENVTVVIDDVLYPIAAEGTEISSEYLEEKTRYENSFRDKIIAALGIPNVLVQVDARIRTTSTETLTREILAENEGSWNPKVTNDSSLSESSTESQSHEPGVMANVGDINEGSGNTQSDTVEEGSSTSQPFAGTMETREIRPVGGTEGLTATVRIPYGYFAAIAKQESGSDSEPSSDIVRAAFARELPSLRATVLRSVGLSDAEADNIEVNYYYDSSFIEGGSSYVTGGGAFGAGSDELAAGSASGFFRQYAKHVAVSALAMISLFMVLMMVRRASGPVDLSEEEATTLLQGTVRTPEALSMEDSNLTDVDGGAVLSGLEVSPDTMRSQNILRQIREMVKESPDNAATLLSKWIADDS